MPACLVAGRASKKPGARSGPRLVVRPEGGPAACGLARDGHRSPVDDAADGRHRARVGRGSSSFGAASIRVGATASDLRAGGESTRRPATESTWRNDGVGNTTDDVGMPRPPRHRLRRTIGRTGVVLLNWRRVDDLEPGVLEHRERAVVGLAAGTLRPFTSDGYASRIVAPSLLAQAIAPSRSAFATPRPRAVRETTKQTIDQTGLSSIGARSFGVGQALVGRSRREAHPADGAAVLVADQTRRRPIAGQRRESLAVAVGARVRPVEAADPVELAPAPLGVAALLEERGQVGPAIRRQRVDRDRVARIRHRSACRDASRGAGHGSSGFRSVPGNVVPDARRLRVPTTIDS